MRIAVDARELEGRPTGVGRVLSGLLSAWPDGDELVLLCRSEPRTPAPAPPLWRTRLAPGPAGLPGTLWEQLVLPGEAQAVGAQALLCPAYGMPWRAPCPTVVGMHDCSWEALPDTFSYRERWRRRLVARMAARRAAALFMGSQFAALEAERWLPVARERLNVVPYGVDGSFVPATDEAIERVRRRYRLSPKTVLFVGSHLPRRSLAGALEGVRKVVAARADAELCLVGNDDDVASPDAGPSDAARSLGYVDEADLAALYSAVTVVVYPSSYEGFGLPVMEALACGSPVVTSAAGSLGEIYRERAWIVDSESAESWATAVATLLDESETRSHWARRGGDWARRRSWDDAATGVRALLAVAAGETP